jgi:hypothetical protein
VLRHRTSVTHHMQSFKMHSCHCDAQANIVRERSDTHLDSRETLAADYAFYHRLKSHALLMQLRPALHIARSSNTPLPPSITRLAKT